MTIDIQSTSDSKEAVTAALGDLAPKTPVETKTEEPAETVEAKPAEETPDAPEADAETKETEPSEPESEDEESEELEAKTDDETTEKPKSKKGGFQRRIDKLNKRNADIEREKEYWREQALKTKPAEKPESNSSFVDQALRPKASDFATHDEYLEALVDWKADQKLQAVRLKEQEDKVKTEIQTKFSTHQSRVTAFKETHDDFDDALESVSTIPMSIAVQDAILESDHGPEMMYALANDPKEFKRLCSLPPFAASREMGKLEAKFSKSTSKSSTETKTTKAPKPVTPVRTRGATTSKSIYDAANLSQREYEALRAGQLTNSMRR